MDCERSVVLNQQEGTTSLKSGNRSSNSDIPTSLVFSCISLTSEVGNVFTDNLSDELSLGNTDNYALDMKAH